MDIDLKEEIRKQDELLSSYMKKLEQTESREEYDMLLSKIVVVGTYLKRRKNKLLFLFLDNKIN